MSMELNTESFFDKMKNGLESFKQTVVGEKGKNLAGVLAVVILSNGLAMGQANANEQTAPEAPSSNFSQVIQGDTATFDSDLTSYGYQVDQVAGEVTSMEINGAEIDITEIPSELSDIMVKPGVKYDGEVETSEFDKYMESHPDVFQNLMSTADYSNMDLDTYMIKGDNPFANEDDPSNVSVEVVNIQETLEEFNASYTSSEQEAVLVSGYYLNMLEGEESTSLNDILNANQESHADYINSSNQSYREYSVVDYAKDMKIKANESGVTVDDIPNYIVSGVNSVYMDYSDMTPMEANTAVAKAESIYGDEIEKPYNTAEGAVETLNSIYSSKIRNDGGIWTGDDVSFDNNFIKKEVNDFLKSGVTQDDVENLPRFLEHKDTYNNDFASVMDDLKTQVGTPTMKDSREDLSNPLPDRDVFKSPRMV